VIVLHRLLGHPIGSIFKGQEVALYRLLGHPIGPIFRGQEVTLYRLLGDPIGPISRGQEVALYRLLGHTIGPIYKGQEVALYRRFGTTYRSHLQVSRSSSVPTFRDNVSVPSSRVKKTGSTDCPETSVQNYHSTLRNIPEERRSYLHRGVSLI
jgi:hypothetical protein